MEDERVADDEEYDYEYEDDDIDDDDMAAGDSGGGGASAGGGAAGSGKGAGGGGGGGASSAAEAEVDVALRDETAVAFVDQAQLKVLMSKVVSDIRYVLYIVQLDRSGCDASSCGYSTSLFADA